MQHHAGNSVAFLAVLTGAQHSRRREDSGVCSQWEQFFRIIQVGLVIIKTASPTNECI